jgi:hypothetical protein
VDPTTPIAHLCISASSHVTRFPHAAATAASSHFRRRPMTASRHLVCDQLLRALRRSSRGGRSGWGSWQGGTRCGRVAPASLPPRASRWRPRCGGRWRLKEEVSAGTTRSAGWKPACTCRRGSSWRWRRLWRAHERRAGVGFEKQNCSVRVLTGLPNGSSSKWKV